MEAAKGNIGSNHSQNLNLRSSRESPSASDVNPETASAKRTSKKLSAILNVLLLIARMLSTEAMAGLHGRQTSLTPEYLFCTAYSILGRIWRAFLPKQHKTALTRARSLPLSAAQPSSIHSMVLDCSNAGQGFCGCCPRCVTDHAVPADRGVRGEIF